MKTNIFIPEKINVGFQEREDTYTKKLAYVIYFDQKGTLRKEASWSNWRDNSIEAEIHENIPTTGFVLNKKAGGYSTGWNHRQTYVRVYDPRGFEFEISVPNLLYILENTNSIKGKGLEGEFVYGWDGKDLVLIPTDSPDYIEITEFNKIIHEKKHIRGKDLKVGCTYLTKNNEQYIYMGKFDKYDYYGKKEKGKAHYFYVGGDYSYFDTIKSLGDKIISVVSEDCVDNYAELIDKLEHTTDYSPIDKSKDEYVSYTLEEFKERIKVQNWLYCFNSNKEEFKVDAYHEKPKLHKTGHGFYGHNSTTFNNLEELYYSIKPMYKNVYLKNGKLYRKEK
ncbi:hypothetical protein V1503_19515 [Bacillus sp. SCS-151]|uniref:hypothetical protein n=1 Tax=Nanhaiella sioensis TaxID=3115293 RepID=UPI00397A7EE8